MAKKGEECSAGGKDRRREEMGSTSGVLMTSSGCVARTSSAASMAIRQSKSERGRCARTVHNSANSSVDGEDNGMIEVIV